MKAISQLPIGLSQLSAIGDDCFGIKTCYAQKLSVRIPDAS